jgi:hypothetical protein
MSPESNCAAPYDVCGKVGPATTNPACAQRDSRAAKSSGAAVKPWLNMISGNGPAAGCASSTGAGLLGTAPVAGYQTRVGSGRSAPRAKEKSRRPTANDRAGARPGSGV